MTWSKCDHKGVPTWLARISESCEIAGIDSIVLGSNGEKDLDLLFVSRLGTINSSYSMVSQFLESCFNLVPPAFRVIVRHEHRAFIETSGPVLHLMYYPSYPHLIACELPSFIAYVHDKGRFLSGSATSLTEYYIPYRRREPQISIRPLTHHLIRYSEMAIMNLLYLSHDQEFMPENVYLENLLYLMRFTITELLVESTPGDRRISFWDRIELQSYLGLYYPAFSKTRDLLSLSYPYAIIPSRELLQEYFLCFLKAIDRSLSRTEKKCIDCFLTSVEASL